MDNRDPNSYASRLRQRRFVVVAEVTERVPQPVRILDLGGTETYWLNLQYNGLSRCEVTLLNLEGGDTASENFTTVVGDARDLSQYHDNAFDIVFSNSVIEHVGNLDHQSRMAQEVRRVGRYYYVQTPSRFFPIEPHFLFPYWHFLPRALRVFLVQRYSIGWYGRAQSSEQASAWVDGVRLLSPSELRRLFPEARIVRERFCGLTKSIAVAYTPKEETGALSRNVPVFATETQGGPGRAAA